MGLRLLGDDGYVVAHHFGIPRSKGHISQELSNLFERVKDAPAVGLEVNLRCDCGDVERATTFPGPAARAEVFRSLRCMVWGIESEIRGRHEG